MRKITNLKESIEILVSKIFLDSIVTDQIQWTGEVNVPSKDDRQITKLIVNEDKIKWAISILNHQGLVGSIQHEDHNDTQTTTLNVSRIIHCHHETLVD